MLRILVKLGQSHCSVAIILGDGDGLEIDGGAVTSAVSQTNCLVGRPLATHDNNMLFLDGILVHGGVEPRVGLAVVVGEAIFDLFNCGVNLVLRVGMGLVVFRASLAFPLIGDSFERRRGVGGKERDLVREREWRELPKPSDGFLDRSAGRHLVERRFPERCRVCSFTGLRYPRFASSRPFQRGEGLLSVFKWSRTYLACRPWCRRRASL